MKTVLIMLFSSSFLVAGFLNVLRQIRNTTALDEIVRFINLVKTEVHYRTADYEDIYLKGKMQNYNYLSFSDGKIYVDKTVGETCANEFGDFVDRIGTTDESGQLSLCDEFKERFSEYLKNRKLKEKEKIQVNAALSVLGALTVLIFFL